MSNYPQETFRNAHFGANGFWAKKRANISSVALLYQLDVLKSTGRYDCFKLQWHDIYNDEAEIWPVPKHLFWDSDVAKWIEGACYFLAEKEHKTVRDAVDELVDMIASAQQPDGYLNVHFTVVDPKGRFTDLRDLHELYNAGHLIEAALAHEQLYGNRKLLDPLVRYVDLFYDTFGPIDQGKKPGYPGHPEIELSLLRLYERTKNPKHLELAQFFLTERGNPTGIDGKHYYTYEAEKRGEGPHEVPDYYPAAKSYWYQQAHEPILDQKTIEGHSVRAMYLLAALADLVRIQGSKLDKAYTDSLYRLWNNMVHQKMYLTGGIGAIKQWEGFGVDHYLPQGTDEGGCYAETCASIGVIMLADRLLEIERNGSFGDIMELNLYNAVLTGVSTNGKAWTYVNQLASSDQDLSQRSDWFTVACCPPNVLRLLGDLAGYCFSAKTDGAKLDLTITLYADLTITEKVGESEVKVTMKTAWPLDGKVEFEVQCPENIELTLHLRIPGWAGENWKVEPSSGQPKPTNGYITLLPSAVRQAPKFTLDIPMNPFYISPHPHTNQNIAAVQRGPLVYCAEDADNTWVTDHFKSVVIDRDGSKLSERQIRDDVTGEDYVAITAKGAARQLTSDAFGTGGPGYISSELAKVDKAGDGDLHFVPYYFRGNRGGKGHMRVGLRFI